ncbi:twin-arginine translocase TatA/TatE family subunit [Sphingomicrobium arenosum]|uniref:twin-arginine translocase TatA/TatE family subunit n=1 Tax=Sphingomicrobium arenosum TaxID=2233861 RepID=UPI00223EE94E|nr:twin-arginine translocase TatA/TatE family subunit [Sphingomicrobium arenosum]
MGNIGLPGLLILAFIILLLFGRGRFSSLMGDVAQGLKSFKKGMAEEEEAKRPAEPRQLPREDQTIEAEVKRDREQDKPAG